MSNLDNPTNDLPLELQNSILSDEVDSLYSQLNEKFSYQKKYIDSCKEIQQLREVNAMLNDQYSKMSNSKWMKLHPIRYVPKKIRNLSKTIRQQGLRGLVRVKRRGRFIDEHIHGKSVNIYDFLLPDTIVNQIRTKFAKDIKFSVIVPIYNTDELFLKQMIDSVINQTYPNWELCLADASDDKHSYVGEIIKEFCKQDNRIKYKKLADNKGISENTNAALDMSTGDYISLLDHDDILHPSALFENMKAICDKDADFIYTDELTFIDDNIHNYTVIHLKPDFAIDNLRANNYICHFTSFKKSLLDVAGKFNPEYDGSQDYDMVLRLTEKANNIIHIPIVMYYWRCHEGSVSSGIEAKPYCITSAIKAISAHLERVGLKGKVGLAPTLGSTYKIDYEIKDRPLISIIIPNKDHISDLHRCLKSIENSTYTNYEIIVVENNSTEKDTFKYYDYISEFNNINVINYSGEFNYSKINNFATKYATGSYYLFLNNDTEVITENWIEEMLMFAQRDDVGAVGAKLLFSDKSIQHAGVITKGHILNMAAHSHYMTDYDNPGYMGKLRYAQNVTAVTGACLLIDKDKFNFVNGFDENLSVAYNDVDLCLKLLTNNFLNIFTPFAELYHYESLSRGFDLTNKTKLKRLIAEEKLLKSKWKTILKNGDPYYNPNFDEDESYRFDIKEYI